MTSARPGEGKSTVTSGLARAIRGDGDTVAVIEADLRRSGAGPILAGSHTEPMLGLAEFMAGAGTVHDIAVGIDASGATVIPAGPAPSDAAARLRPERFSELVDHLLQTHDWVLIDGPPVEGHADSLLLASRRGADAARRRSVAEHDLGASPRRGGSCGSSAPGRRARRARTRCRRRGPRSPASRRGRGRRGRDLRSREDLAVRRSPPQPRVAPQPPVLPLQVVPVAQRAKALAAVEVAARHLLPVVDDLGSGT